MELPPALHRNLVVESGCRVIGSDYGALHAILCIDAVSSCAVCHPVSPSCRLEVSTGLRSRAARDGVPGRGAWSGLGRAAGGANTDTHAAPDETHAAARPARPAGMGTRHDADRRETRDATGPHHRNMPACDAHADVPDPRREPWPVRSRTGDEGKKSITAVSSDAPAYP